MDRTAKFHKARLWPSHRGIPTLVLGLIGGSVVAIALSMILIFVFGAGLGLICVGLLVSYAVCGCGIAWFFRPLNGENSENVLEVRTEQVRLANERRRVAMQVVKNKTASAEKADQLLQSIRQIQQSEVYRRKREIERLLSIDPGRLYPDEFERFVGEVFAFLGFTITLTGRSGDQGVDVIACKGPLRLAIQCKRYIGAVGNSSVQEVYAGMAHHKCHRCLVITNSAFTQGAIGLAGAQAAS